MIGPDEGVIGTSQPNTVASSGSSRDDILASVQRLLEGGLEYAPTPVQPRQGLFQNITGNLGDAITAMAAVRAGGAPPAEGTYGRTVREKRLRFTTAQNDALGANRDLRNKVRLAAAADVEQRGKEGRQLQGQKELAAIRTANRPLRFVPATINVDGVPTRVIDAYDATTGEHVGTQSQGEAGFAPSIQPGMIGGEGGQPPKAGFVRIPRGSGNTTVVPGPGGRTLEPPPPAALASEAGGKAGVLAGIPGLKQAFSDADLELRGGNLQEIKTWLQAQTQGTRFEQVAEPVALQKYYAAVRGVLTPYIQNVSGKQVPESEFRRYEARMPIPGVTPPEAVDSKWGSLINEMVRDIKAKYAAQGRNPPAIPSTAAPSGGISDEEVERIRQKSLGGQQ